MSGSTRSLNAEIKLNLNFAIGSPSFGVHRGPKSFSPGFWLLALSKNGFYRWFSQRGLRIKRVCSKQLLNLHLPRGKPLLVRISDDCFEHRRVGFDPVGKRVVAQPVGGHGEILLSENQRCGNLFDQLLASEIGRASCRERG